MTVLLLAACGKVADQPAPTTASTPTAPLTASDATATGVHVTVPSLEPPSSSVRTLIPLRSVTSAPAVASTSSATPKSSATTTVAGPPAASPATAATTQSGSSVPTIRSATSSSRRVSSAGLSGKVVAIDPGHNGANGEHPEIINRVIDGGYGQRHLCNTTGTQTDAGYPEHLFAWNVATYLKSLLAAKGISVVMTRSNDTGVGPCTDKRAAIENNADADAVVSIHGDGAPAEVRGFYVITATRPPAGPTIAADSLRLAACIAQAAENEGFPPSNTLGSGGLWQRDDLTGLNRSTRPKILIECGNMRNAAEAALMSSGSGQRRYAQALAQGVFSYLKG